MKTRLYHLATAIAVSIACFSQEDSLQLILPDTDGTGAEWMIAPEKKELPYKNKLVLYFCDSMIQKQVGKGICRNLIQEALEYAGYEVSKGNSNKNMEYFLDGRTFLVTQILTAGSICFWTDNDSLMMDSTTALKHFSDCVLPGDIMLFYYTEEGIFRDKAKGHIVIIKQVHTDGTMSVYEQNYEDGGLMRRMVSVNPYSVYDYEYIFFAKP